MMLEILRIARHLLFFFEYVLAQQYFVTYRTLSLGTIHFKSEDKNNDRLNRRLMTRFKETLDEAQLMEIDLHGRALYSE
jgi:hypothetical protein